MRARKTRHTKHRTAGHPGRCRSSQAQSATLESLEGRLLLAAGPGAGVEMLRFGPAEIAERLPIGPVFIEAIDADGAMHIRRGDEAMAIESGAETVTRLGESWTSSDTRLFEPFPLLRIDGTDADDVIRITDTDSGVAVRMNGETGIHTGVFRRIEVYGYEGRDEIRYDGELPLWAYGGPGDDTLVGGTGRDSLYGEEGHDRLEGGDEFFGVFPLDEIPDVTWFRDRGVRGDRLDGGPGNDHILGGDEMILALMDLGGMVGTAAPVHTGIPGDEIHGGDGADAIFGGTGDDIIHGDAGRDTIDGGSGNDEIHGGDECLGTFSYHPGKDWLTTVGLGGDLILGGYGNDTICGGDEWVNVLTHIGYGMAPVPYYYDVPGDWIDGAGGTDTIHGDGGDDTIVGGPGVDGVWGDAGHDDLDGGVDGDDLHGNDHNDTIYGGRGSDTIFGGNGDDVIRCGPGTYHYVQCGQGNDTVWGGHDTDDVWGADGDDTIHGNGGDDRLRGDDGIDHIYGNGGEDTIRGGDGGDFLYGGNENDTVYGGLGDDLIEGGQGFDTLYGDRESGDSYLDGNDTIRGGPQTDFIFGQQGDDIIEGGDGGDEIDAGPGDDDVWGDSGLDVINAGSGNDEVWGGDHSDTIDGGWGNDTIYGGGGNDWIHGGDGTDVIDGEGGDDTILGGWHADYLYGGPGNDMLYGEVEGAHHSGFEDWLWGNEGNDRLVGGKGDDHLMGGGGQDALFCLEGSDIEIVPDDVGAVGRSDRIYTRSRTTARRWDDGADAAFYVRDTSEAWWTYEELYRVDDAIRLIHETNGSDALIQKSDGGYVELVRERHAWWDGELNGWNDGNGVYITDSAISGRLGPIVVHELGHFWDTESPVWEDFLDVQDWTMISHAGQRGWHYAYRYGEEWWWHDPAEFYRDYSREHPVEDWATCWEAYFYGRPGSRTPDPTHTWMATNMPDKFAVIDPFLRLHMR